ncbi:DUF4124 domain-containing protein [Saccharophagus degradans]|uniref:DUF4124 domain-containing protein n=1 Tax=Saccharophagus degradans TaxID=86304 RepID=UPI0024781B64|nr:DUF4124 domain-containing protein [Saccharophagus degradans]WGO98071.1 DUF4124 domain-containing protein [Saccharophagus degradans]
MLTKAYRAGANPMRKSYCNTSIIKWLIALCCCTLSSALVADIYKHVDENGKVTYTDSKVDNSEKVDLPPINTQSPQKIMAPKPKPNHGPVPIKLSLVSPTHEQQVGPAFKTLTMSLSSNRDLTGDELFQFFMNGLPVTLPTRDTTVTVGPLKRGKNTASVKVVMPSGKVVASSASVTFYVIRP